MAGVILGVAAARFVSYDGDGSPGAARAPARSAATAAERIAALELEIAVDPDDLAARQALGVAYLQQAVQIGDPSFYAQAEQAFDAADGLLADHPGTLLGRGVAALSLHEFARASELGEQVTAELPRSADALGLLVDAQVELGRYDAAASTLQDMLDRRPGLPALSRTSYLRQLNGDLPGAIDAMQRAEVAGAGSPFDEATVVALVGDLRFLDADPDAALDAYERALELSPGLLGAEIGRARVLGATGDARRAIGMLEDVVDRYPTPTALVLLGELQEVAGRADAAADTYELVRAVAALQEDAGQIVDLEMAVFEADVAAAPDRGVALARAAHDARPDNVFVADALAWALLRAGDAEGAVPFAEQAVRLGTADVLLRYHAAEVFAAVGDTTRATEQIEAAVALNPRWSIRHRPALLALAEQLAVPVPPFEER